MMMVVVMALITHYCGLSTQDEWKIQPLFCCKIILRLMRILKKLFIVLQCVTVKKNVYQAMGELATKFILTFCNNYKLKATNDTMILYVSNFKLLFTVHHALLHLSDLPWQTVKSSLPVVVACFLLSLFSLECF